MGHPMDSEIDARLKAEEKKPAAKHDHPAHYGGKDNVYETIKVLESWFGDVSALPFVVAFELGNTIKYISRAGKKPGESVLDDLKKSRFYLDRAITFLEAWLEGK